MRSSNRHRQRTQGDAKALKVDGPAIVDCVVADDELPNIPHLELAMMGNYAKAKFKKTMLALTGG